MAALTAMRVSCASLQVAANNLPVPLLGGQHLAIRPCMGSIEGCAALGALAHCRRPASRRAVQARAKARTSAATARAPAAATEGALARVAVRTQHRVAFGEVLRLVGAPAQLGAWDPAAAPVMEWSEGHLWRLEAQLPPGPHAFKCCVTRDDGSIVEWQPGADCRLEVDEAALAQGLDVDNVWANSAELTVTLSQDESDSESAEGEARARTAAEQSSSEPLPWQRALELLGSGLVKVSSSNGAPKGASDGLGVDDAGRFAFATQAVQEEKAESGKTATSAPEAASDAVAEPATSSTAERKDAHTEAAQQEARPAEPASRALEVAAAAPAAVGGTARGGPLNSVATGLGLAALPVVAWSLFTLRNTGCGLPPGPSGALGAAEGLAYLTVVGVALAGVAARRRGSSFPAGLRGRLVEVGAYVALAAGAGVLALQVQQYGYIPAALPDSHCYGSGAPNAARRSPKSARPVTAAAPAAPDAAAAAPRYWTAAVPLSARSAPVLAAVSARA